MTPEQRAEAIRRCGYREPLPEELWRRAAILVVTTASLITIGAWALVFGDAGERTRGGFMLTVGLVLCWRQWRFYRLPVAPVSNADLAREVRHRDALDDEHGTTERP